MSRPRIRKAEPAPAPRETPVRPNNPLVPIDELITQEKVDARSAAMPPVDWILGQLLNVCNRGADYCVTLMEEEFDPRRPERALIFSNSADCQNFVSRWYARVWDGH